MSIQEIEKAIQDTEIALSANPQGRTKELLLIGLQAFNDMLLAEQQKKSAVQPIEKVEQLPQTNPEKERHEFTPTGQTTYIGKTEKIRELPGNYQGDKRVIGTVTAAPVITIPVVEISLSSGTRQMNRTDIMNMLKTWFKRVATSKAMEKGRFSDAYGGAMGQDTYKLFQGWNTIYNETKEGSAWPPMEDCFPGLGRASQSQKVNAEILWRWASNDT